MNKKTLEQRCTFRTRRLSISSWTNQVKDVNSKNDFGKKVIDILTPKVTKALPSGWQHISTLDAALDWIAKRDQESHFVTVQHSSTGDTIGFIFLYEINLENNCYNLRFGYLLSEKTWGQGLGTELIEGLIKWCKASGDIKSISGGVESDNIGSIIVLERNGFLESTMEKSTEQMTFYEYRFDVSEKDRKSK